MKTYYPMKNGIVKITFKKINRDKCIRIECENIQMHGYFCAKHVKRK